MKKYLSSFNLLIAYSFTLFSKDLPSFNKYFLFFLFFINLPFTSIKGQDSLAIIQQLENINWANKTAFDSFEKEMEIGKKILPTTSIVNYYELALEKAQSTPRDTLVFKYTDNLIFYARLLGNYESMLKYAEISLRKAQELNFRQKITNAFKIIGQSWAAQKKYVPAIEAYLKALDSSDKEENQNAKIATYNNMAICYANLGQFEEAVSLIKEGMAYVLVNHPRYNFYTVANCNALISFYEELGNKDSTQVYIDKLIQSSSLLERDTIFEISVEMCEYALSQSYFTLVDFFVTEKNLTKATVYYNAFKKLKNTSETDTYIVDILFSLVNKEFDKTRQLVENLPMAFDSSYLDYYFRYAADYYEEIGDYQQGLAFYKKEKAKEISRLRSITINYTEFTNIKLDNAEKKQALLQLKNDQLAQKRRTQLFIFSLIFALVLLSLLAYLYTQIKRKNSLLKEDLKKQGIIEQQAKKLQLADEQKNRLLVNLAHELQTPLSIINGLSTKLVNNAISEGDRKNYSKVIHANGTHLSGQVEQILALSQLENFKPKLNNRFFYLNELIEQLIIELQYKADSKNIQLVFEEKAEQRLLNADVEKLKTVLKNLIVNAIHHSFSQSLVVINLSDKAEVGYEVTIKDLGKGIPAEDIPHLFDRYFQSNQPKSNGGFGIGLSICKEYMNLLAGNIHIESKLGFGSVFIVSIPKNIKNVSIEAVDILRLTPTINIKKETTLSTSSSKLENKRILIVEDNQDFYIYLESILSPHFDLFYVQNGAEAINYLAQNQPDLILTDWMMPEKDGMELINHLKADITYKGIPIVVLTARSLISDQLKAINLGAADYLLKTAKEEVILEKITSLLIYNEERDSVKPAESFEFYQATKDNFLKLDKNDQTWLLQLEKNIRLNLPDYDLKLSIIAASLDVSLSHLNRKVKKVTGLTTMNYIQELRYWEARRMLEEKKAKSVKRVCLSVGFKDIKNFSRNFKARFGGYPSEYIK